MITIPSLDSTQDIADSDLLLVTTSEGLSYKMAGSELNKRHKVVIASSTTITGAPLKTGNVVRVYFTADITALNASTALVLNYNTVNYTVKIPKDGALVNYVAFQRGTTYKYLQAYTTLELLFDGTNFVLIENPVVWSGNDFTIFANTSVHKGDVGLGSVANTGDSATPSSGGTTKFTTGGAYTELAKKVDKTSIGAASGVAGLDASGKVPSNQLPSYVDDVLEYANKASFPATGEAGKIYVDKATGKTWRWSGSAYVELSSYAEASQSASGLMSATDKTKLDGLTKGTAAGNVPDIGTALGTTDGNIVVTDSNGKLKPSGKKVGTAAGNVPDIGTALGTTDGNIVVTDSNGKLKPSGKKVGTAAGNVPDIGTALGNTNNNIVVTDSNGKLKPSGTTIGSAAGKTAGAAAGNVPLIGTALGTTDNKLVVTDPNGKLKTSEFTDTETYSTSETKTNKKWIDGKDIYRRVFTVTNKGTSGTVEFGTLTGVAQMIDAYGFIKCSSGTYSGNQFNIPRDREELRLTNNNVLQLGGRDTSVNTDYAVLIVEYTKTS